ncbi:MAG TPA: hypothetical protein VF746_03885 [Longimicrobium sp.]
MSTGDQALRELAAEVRTGRGVVALFTGGGAARAAEEIARELGAEVRRLDAESLAARDIAANERHAVAVLEGADAVSAADLDRLVDRAEAGPGLVILTADTGDALDAAFLGRLRFVLDFPSPRNG